MQIDTIQTSDAVAVDTIAREADAPLHAGAFAFSPDFPVIENVSDIEAHVRPDAGLKIHVWGGRFLGANYAITMPETFQGPIDLEWRGLIFNRETGKLVSRPFHKFFGIMERQGLADLDLSVPSWTEDKLDGSMISAFVDTDQEVVFHTRGGFSSQALAARMLATDSLLRLVREVYAAGFTPIFEWTSPKNRIVIKYDADALTLLAIRHRRTGAYMPKSDLEAIAAAHGVPTRPVRGPGPQTVEELKRLFNDVRGMEGEEGLVLVFENGHRLKFKADQYRLHHKIVSDIALEKNAYRAWVDNAIDDIAPILGDERGAALLEFGAAIDRHMLAHVTVIEDLLDETADLDGKARAAAIARSLPKPLQGAAFAMAKGQDGMDQMRRILTWGFGSLDKMAEVRKVFDLPRWSLDVGDLDG